MSDAGENHGNPVFIGRFDNLFITDRAAWLNHRRRAPLDSLK
jgi:hypothetical protein